MTDSETLALTEPIEESFDDAPEESALPDPFGLVTQLQNEAQLSEEAARAVAEAVIAQLQQMPQLKPTPLMLRALVDAQLQAAQLNDAQRARTAGRFVRSRRSTHSGRARHRRQLSQSRARP